MLESQLVLDDHSVDLITIVFAHELDLLKIQAKSIELYVPDEFVNHIIIVVNDDLPVIDQIDPLWWGKNSHKVKIIHRSMWGPIFNLSGWQSQQLYKILAAETAISEWAVCLDAKTWFVNHLNRKLFFNREGKIKFSWFPVIPVFDPAKKTLETIFNIEMTDVIGPGGVPFVFRTNSIRSMICWIETSQNKSFIDFFVDNIQWPKQITEFMLYSAYIKMVHGNYMFLYDYDQYYTITNIAHNEADRFDEKFFIMSRRNALTASIHRNAYQHLTDRQITQWVDFLVDKQLITDPENFKTAINTLRLQANDV